MECQENEYLDERRKCILCRECGPGWELSKVIWLLWGEPGLLALVILDESFASLYWKDSLRVFSDMGVCAYKKNSAS